MTMLPSVGGIATSAAGSSLSQSTGASAERASRDAAASDRVREQQQAADAAAGIGQTDADQESGDRDADGRRQWELAPIGSDDSAAGDCSLSHDRPVDPKGEAGTTLDLLG
jgi:hypothetical protein